MATKAPAVLGQCCGQTPAEANGELIPLESDSSQCKYHCPIYGQIIIKGW